MNKRKKLIMAVLSVLVLAGLAYGFYDVVWGEEQIPNYQISAILLYDGSGEWKNMQQGIRQAAELNHFSVSYIVMPQEADSKEQKELLKREIDNGAHGILLMAEDEREMAEAVEEAKEKVPILLLESGVSQEECTTGDNYGMGKLLGKKVQEDGHSKIAVIKKAGQRTYTQERMKGLEEGLGKNARIVYLEYDRETKDVAKILRKIFWSADYDSVICVDTATLEKCSDYFYEFHPRAKLYGIGGSSKAASGISRGAIEAIVCQNEFTIGFAGTVKLSGMLKGEARELEQKPEYNLVTAENLYDKAYQQLLFPLER